MDALAIHLNELKRFKTLKNEETLELISRKKHIEAFHGNMKLVLKIVKNLIGKLELDVINAGYIGLNKAIKKFDLSKYGNRFSTYACYLIKTEVLRHLRKEKNSIHLPDFLFEMKSRKKIETKKKNIEKYKDAKKCSNIFSLNRQYISSNGRKVELEINDERYDVEKEVDRKIIKENLFNLINDFDKINKTIISRLLIGESFDALRFSLYNAGIHTYNKKTKQNEAYTKQAIGLRFQRISNLIMDKFLNEYGIEEIKDFCYT